MTEDYARIELQHIQIELVNKRYQHLRHFIDQYFCYKKGYVNGNGNADWGQIFWNEYVSSKAMEKTERSMVRKEHVIPLKRIRQELEKLAETNKTSLEDIAACLDKLVIFATITREEDRKLTAAGLHDRMPPGYDQDGHRLYSNPFARYEITGIQCKYAGNSSMQSSPAKAPRP